MTGSKGERGLGLGSGKVHEPGLEHFFFLYYVFFL